MATNDDLNFLTFVQSFRRGALVSEADDRLSELVEALHEFGGKGKLQITLTAQVNKAGQIEISPAITISKPTKSIGQGIYWASDDNRLTRRDPDQADIEDYIGQQSQAAE